MKGKIRETPWVIEQKYGTPVPPPPPTPPFFTIVTDWVGAVTFTISKTGAAADWNMGDGAGYFGTNSVVHTYTTPGNKTISINVDAFANVQAIGDLTNRGIIEVNFQNLSNLGGQIRLSLNPNLAVINLPTTNQLINVFHAFNTGYTGPLDLSTLQNLSDDIRVSNSPITSITLPGNGNVFTFFLAENCNLTGLMDFTPLSNLGGQIVLNNNPLLTDIAINTPELITLFQATACDLTGKLFMDSAPNLSGVIWFFSNPNLTEVIFAANTTIITDLRIAITGIGPIQDISMLNIGGLLNFRTNPALEQLILPISSNLITQAYFHDCNFGAGPAGALNLDALTNLSGILDVSNNAAIDAQVAVPGANGNAFSEIRLFDNKFYRLPQNIASNLPNCLTTNGALVRAENNLINVAAQMDATLAAFDAITSAGPSGLILNLAGTGNVAPGAPGVISKNSLLAKGVGVTTN